jgi:Pvc16 N-terminal domain
MLHDVDESLRLFLRRRCGISNEIEVAFDAPTRDWSSRRNVPTVDVFLYDLRENLDRRQAALEDERDERGMVNGRPLATRWFNCSYLVTAWTQRAEDEHRLLSSVLLGFLESHTLPTEDRSGSLAETVREVFWTIGRPPTQDRSISDIWSALGGELKPSLDLVLVVPFEPAGSAAFGPPVLEAASVSLNGDSQRAAGYRRAKGSPADRAEALGLKESAALASEELVGGSKAEPGRRFRFAVHEPSNAARPGRAGKNER